MPEELLVHNLAELATLAGGVRKGPMMSDLRIVRKAAILFRDGLVAEIGDSEKLRRKHASAPNVNAGGRAALPGLVDAHTHAVFAGDRVHELALKAKGATYSEILAAGGGILHTMRVTRDATRAELLKALLGRLDRMLEHGTTTAEVKTGYGLDKDTELRMLDVIERANARHPVDCVPTFLGAHALPPEFDSTSAYAEFVAREVVPAAAESAESCDVYCDPGAFSIADARIVLEAGAREGMRLKVHAEEIGHTGAAALAAELGAMSADHLLKITADDVALLAKSSVMPVLLPATALALRAPFADARALIDAGAPVALGTDLSPNCYTESMPFVAALACHGMHMTPEETVSAATINAAAASGRANVAGSLEVGKQGDLLILDAPSVTHLGYRLGTNPAWKVVKLGEVVVDRSDKRR